MTKTTSLEFLGLPAEAVKKLEELHITSVEAFYARAFDPEPREKLRVYIGIDDVTMGAAIQIAFEIAPIPQLHERPLGGALIPEDGADEKAVLAQRHDQFLRVGIAVKFRLDQSVCAQLESPEGIEPLRHELRHSSYVKHVSAVDIRCAVVVAEFSAALEELVFQDGGMPPRVRLHPSGEVYVGTDFVSKDYFVGRIADAISCDDEQDEQLADELFKGLMKEMFSGRFWFPGFKLSRETCVVLEHDSV